MDIKIQNFRKRKRICRLASSSESEYSEPEGSDESPPSSPVNVRASSSKKKTKNSDQKENVNVSTPVLQKRLSAFASPGIPQLI
jgi:hypothetical protein